MTATSPPLASPRRSSQKLVRCIPWLWMITIEDWFLPFVAPEVIPVLEETFSAAVLLALLALVTLVLKEILERKTRIKDIQEEA